MPNITQVLIILAIIAVFATVTIILIIENSNRKKHPTPIKPLRNKLSRFCENNERGQLIKIIPVGREKKLRKIIYSATIKDEFNNESLKYYPIIVHPSQIKNTDKEMTVLPINPEELDARDPETTAYKEYLKQNLNIDLISNSIIKDRKQFERNFQENFGSQLHNIVKEELYGVIKELKNEKSNNLEDNNKEKVKT